MILITRLNCLQVMPLSVPLHKQEKVISYALSVFARQDVQVLAREGRYQAINNVLKLQANNPMGPYLCKVYAQAISRATPTLESPQKLENDR